MPGAGELISNGYPCGPEPGKGKNCMMEESRFSAQFLSQKHAGGKRENR